METRYRRSFIAKGLIAFAAGLPIIGGFIAGRAAAEEEEGPLETEGQILRANVYQGRPQPMEPLDTMIRFERSDNHNDRAMTHEILSLMHEEKGAKSYPWTIYSHLTTHHIEGDACVLCSRLHKEGAGWSCGLHSEVFNSARAVGIGVNIEMTNNYSGPEPSEIIGMNVQILPGNPCQYGIQIHGPGLVHTGIGLNGKGDVGLDLGGKYEIGINTRGNSIRLDEGTCIELDSAGKVRLRYKDGRIEFLNGEKCVGHIRVDGEDHEL